MNVEALANIRRKQNRLADTQKWANETRLGLLEKEREAQEALENVVGFVLDGHHAKITQIARELGCSRDKVRGMANRARLRNAKLTRGRSHD